MTNRNLKEDSSSKLYQKQNTAIHKARAQLGMGLDDCRRLAFEIAEKTSISSLTAKQRWELIEELIKKGALISNPALSVSYESPKDVYNNRLRYWNSRFPRRRYGFATNKQLAWIEALWELDFYDGRGDIKKGLRSFVQRQTMNFKDGPVSDLSFLKEHHVSSILTPLKKKAKR
jgi:hypothetical protein